MVALRNRIRNVANASVALVDDDALEKFNKRVQLIEVERGVKFEECVATEHAERERAIERFDDRPELRLRRYWD